MFERAMARAGRDEVGQSLADPLQLGEIGELLALSARRDGDMAGMKSAAQQKLADVDAKLAELQRIRQGLTDLVASCPGHGALEHCPILDALAGASR